MYLGLKKVYFLVRFKLPKSMPKLKSRSERLMKPAWRDSSRAKYVISCLMSGLLTFFRISLYSTQPENSEVRELTKKSMNSCRISGDKLAMPEATSSANAASR